MPKRILNPYILIISIVFLMTDLTAQSLISYLEGDVLINREGVEMVGDFGFQLMNNDIIITGENSLAVLEIESRGTLKLRAQTKLRLETTTEKISIELREGGLFSKIKKLLGWDYEVRTGGTVAGVRGTEFFVAYGQLVEETPDVWLCVNEGIVEVALVETGDSLLVHEGEGITIPSGARLTEPKFYKWTEDLNWNMEPDEGDVADNTDLSGAYTDLLDIDYD